MLVLTYFIALSDSRFIPLRPDTLQCGPIYNAPWKSQLDISITPFFKFALVLALATTTTLHSQLFSLQLRSRFLKTREILRSGSNLFSIYCVKYFILRFHRKRFCTDYRCAIIKTLQIYIHSTRLNILLQARRSQ